VLRKRFEVCDGKREFIVDESCDGDFVCARIDVGNGTVVAIIAVFGDEAVHCVSIMAAYGS